MTRDVTLHLGDCLDVLRGMADGSVDAVVTDPPYGLGDVLHRPGPGEWSRLHGNGSPEWDKSTHPGVMTAVGLARHAIIWGGNYYPLPPVRGWLVWDKQQEHSSGHAELAWSNLNQPVRVFRMSRIEAYSRMKKTHPMQKPVELMRWCIRLLNLPPRSTIFDPYMGSGTTGVAAVAEGHCFVGVEIDPTYFAVAERRIAAAACEDGLFAPVAAQPGLFADPA